MKDNLIRILAAILLLLCFAATARLMGQSESMSFMQEPVFTDPHDPALGGEASLSILPDQVVCTVPQFGHEAIQMIDFQGICSGNFLPGKLSATIFLRHAILVQLFAICVQRF